VVLFAALGISVWVLGACLGIGLLCSRSIEQLGVWGTFTQRRFGYFIKGLEPGYWWWEFFVKRLDLLLTGLVAGSSLAPDDKAKVMLQVMLAGIFFAAQAICKPFVKENLGLADRLELKGLLARLLTFTTLGCIMVVDPPREVSIALALVVAALNTLYLGNLFCHFLSQVALRLSRQPRPMPSAGTTSLKRVVEQGERLLAELTHEVHEILVRLKLVVAEGSVEWQEEPLQDVGRPRWCRTVVALLEHLNHLSPDYQRQYAANTFGEFYRICVSCDIFPKRGFSMLVLLAATAQQHASQLAVPPRQRGLRQVFGGVLRLVAQVHGSAKAGPGALDVETVRDLLERVHEQGCRWASPEHLRRAVIVLSALPQADQALVLRECRDVVDQSQETPAPGESGLLSHVESGRASPVDYSPSPVPSSPRAGPAPVSVPGGARGPGGVHPADCGGGMGPAESGAPPSYSAYRAWRGSPGEGLGDCPSV